MDSHLFKCTLCGECCSGEMKVFLNSFDLYKMGRFLKKNHTEELFKDRLIQLDKGQNDLLLPRIKFKTRPFLFCPFLINDFQEDLGLRGFCSLHLEHKPLVCRLAPLSRRIDLETETQEFEFVLPHPACPGSEEGEILNPRKEESVLAEELAFELRYYKLLSKNEENPSFLWNFPLHKPFEEILKKWEE
jgi:Fe-S-cluster containining protein